MYPNLYYFFHEVFGIDIPALQIFNTFGFFVALSFGISLWLLKKELIRREKAGDIPYQVEEITVGEKVNYTQVAIQAFLGFLFAWKFVGAFTDVSSFQADMKGYFFSFQGNVLAGLIGGALAGYDKYRSMKKAELPIPVREKVKVYPSDRIGEISLTLGISGFVGAKVFNALETWQDFLADPVGNLFSGSGLTFLGGLIFATVAAMILMHRWNVKFLIFADTLAPIMLLAYGIGRMGCLFAGDGDWGVYNSAYYYNQDLGETQEVGPEEFEKYSAQYPEYFSRDGAGTQHLYRPRPAFLSFLPVELFAYTFPHNVNNDGYLMKGCEGKYCSRLPWPVLPTPLYEIILSFIAFAFLWRKRLSMKITGTILATYMILAGLERFLIEPLRVNTEYNLGFIHPSQAQIISLLMIILGIWFFMNRIKRSVVL